MDNFDLINAGSGGTDKPNPFNDEHDKPIPFDNDFMFAWFDWVKCSTFSSLLGSSIIYRAVSLIQCERNILVNNHLSSISVTGKPKVTLFVRFYNTFPVTTAM